MYTERLISKETFDEVGKSELSSAVSEDPNKLRGFASVLLKSKKTVRIGKDILKEYSKLFIFYRFIVLKFCIDENFPQVPVCPSRPGL